MSITYQDIETAARHLSGIAHQTPVITSRTVNNLTGAQVFFKCENFQRAGAFKFRGAYYALSQLSPQQKQQGVLAYSSGNHAQAIALAGKLLEIPTTIIMPTDAPTVKQAATRSYGAEIIFYQRQQITREELAETIANERNLTIIPPYNHPHIIAGQGTTALELITEVGNLDLLLVCCGGGGLLSGCAIASKTLNPECQVIGVEPAVADDATRSFQTQILHTVRDPDTIADGARTPSLGSLTFPLVLQYVDNMVTVPEDSIKQTLRFIWERLKLVVEPTGVLAAAALLTGVISAKNQRVGVILSGGNIDLKRLSQLLEDS